MLVIVDYGLGNLGSIANMLRKSGHDATVTSERSTIERADLLILPGVGAFDQGMTNLRSRGLVEPLTEKVVGAGTPTLGICLGAQLMTEASEEGLQAGLGWLHGRALRFTPNGQGGPIKVPHMGWNDVTQRRPHHLFREMYENPRFYFVHSYFIVCDSAQDVLATASYGAEFTCAFAHRNVLGVQFHPEKSHKYGMRLLDNFARMSEAPAGDRRAPSSSGWV